MKEIKIKANNITQKQWSNFVLELNLMGKQWRPYGVDVQLQGTGIKKIIVSGTRINDKMERKNRPSSNKLEQD